MKKAFYRVSAIAASMALLMCGCRAVKTTVCVANPSSSRPTRPYESSISTTTVANDGNYLYEATISEAMDYELNPFHNTEEYNYIKENGFLSTLTNPLSTFSADVDTASYTNVHRMINNGINVPADAVRIEEFLNYFNYDYKLPNPGEPFGITVEMADCPWNSNNRLLLIGLKTEEIDLDNRPASNFVFLLDVSGSMYSYDKLPLMQKAFSMLAEELTENDRVSIVTYAGAESVVLEGARGNDCLTITNALESLTAGGSTAGEAGIRKAYEIAQKYYIEGGNNRIILATDGDLNVGVSSEGELTRLVSEKRESGVYLSVLGFGTGNIKDNKMEALADNGNGNYSYIDNIFEAKKVLVNEMGGTLYTVAKDVKIQVEFNPAKVSGYRLIGYENRLLSDYEFHDDTVDAGEIGAGHTVTAVYELTLPDTAQAAVAPTLKYQTGTLIESDDLLNIAIRYKAPDSGTSTLTEHAVPSSVYSKEMPDNLKFASCVIEFGMLLRESKYMGSSSYASILAMLDELASYVTEDTYKSEFRTLVEAIRDFARFEAKELSNGLADTIENVQYIRTNGYNELIAFPYIVTVSSHEELLQYYDAYKNLFSLGTEDTAVSGSASGWLGAIEKYDNEWFGSHSLIMVVLEESSGSVCHKVTGIAHYNDADYIAIDVITPEVGTCDMAEWHLLVEAPAFPALSGILFNAFSSGQSDCSCPILNVEQAVSLVTSLRVN